jgi:hypothetical protein
MTVNFDFMHDEVLRSSLERDYHELELCMNVGAWKAVHVLAGSIIETMLIDYLMETDYATRKSTNLKDLSLFGIIKICREEDILSEKTSALSHVIREYRNLIHPEKTKRANETVDENGATIAYALVKMVTGEISVVRKKTFGYTAEQIATKIETDPSVLSIITHLLDNTKESEIKRLPLKIIPQKYLELENLNNEPDAEGYIPKATFNRLAKCYRLAFETASDETKRDIALEFIRVIKEESAEIVKTYKLVFFRGEDLQYFPSQEVHLVIRYLLSKSSENRSASFIENITGIGKFLSDSEVKDFIDLYVTPMIANERDNSDEIDIKKFYLDTEYWSMSSEAKKAALSRLNDWIVVLMKRDDSLAEKLTEIRDYIVLPPPP